MMAVACSDNDATPETGVNAAATRGDLDGLCQAECDRSVACSTSDPEANNEGECLAECVGDYEGWGTKLRSDLVRALAECIATISCNEIDDQCTATAFETIGEDPDEVTRSTDVRTCLDKEQECQDTEGDFSDDLCGVLPFLVVPERQRMARCFEGSCERAQECLVAVFDR